MQGRLITSDTILKCGGHWLCDIYENMKAFIILKA